MSRYDINEVKQIISIALERGFAFVSKLPKYISIIHFKNGVKSIWFIRYYCCWLTRCIRRRAEVKWFCNTSINNYW
ncbi:one cut domain family member,putative [Schistosoma mansoni]|uniref:one cut domain family member,putative n=1 Tax=Schistosoma mansoni TaxID=6183 RepID=UPI00022C875E|nr:one cut domain family member,putative [Schistosoma mansoni]|eukprot:XP_018645149.1 one cut domain family member,putative [Schistosoma mansoni]